MRNMNSKKGFRHLFGPVPSRRLGRSLGIDLVPFKTCTFDCIYCQLGRTTDKTTARHAYVPTREILDELTAYLQDPHGAIDYCTLSGSGEPTLHSGLGRIIASIKRMTAIPVAVLTNGSLLYKKEVRRELAEADVVIPTLAAGSETVFQCVHRPAPAIAFAQFIDGLILFSREFKNHLWLELFLLRGITALEKNTAELNRMIRKIKPEKIQINTATRPPCESFALPVPEKRLRQLSKLISGDVEIVAEKDTRPRAGSRSAAENEILELIMRRPCTVADASCGLYAHAAETSKILARLVRDGRAEVQHSGENTYFKGRIPPGE
jgi:wyosine [tRNA(Phe)-imidazoG37] synthetase (radical SAM superfamily)